jgi:hypothetical protein
MESLFLSVCLLFQLASTQTDWTGGQGVAGPVGDFGTAFYASDSVTYNVSGQISPVACSTNLRGWIKHTVERNPRIDGHGGLYPADFDGDGDLDLSGWMTLACSMRFYQNFKVESDSVGYRKVTTYAAPPGAKGKYGQTWAGDINGDGRPDVAVACSTRVFWYENLGNFSFALRDLGPAIHTKGAVEGADINRDGLMDLVVGDMPLEVWYQEPGGTFRREYVWSGESYKILVGDINGDTWPDLMAEDQVFLNNNGTFPTTPTWTAGLSGPDGIWIRDVNNDRRPDVLVCDQWSSTPGIYWYENLGNGTGFRQHTVYKRADARSYGDGACAEDLDGDGKADIVGSYSRVGFFRQVTPDSFVLVELDTITDSHWIRTANLDYKPNGSDADMDILVTGRGQFAWYENAMQAKFSCNGWLVSSILDAGFPASWQTLVWDATRPVGTRLDFYVRTGATPGLCTTSVWSGPISVQTGVQFDSTSLQPYIGSDDRYFQYRVVMASNNVQVLTPTVRLVKVVFIDNQAHDVGTVRINAPAQVADTVSFFTPSADVFNYGNREETFLVRFIMTYANGDPFYRDSSVITLQPSTGRTQLFRQAKFLQVGQYVVNCSTALEVDEYRGNDAVTQMTVVEGEPDHDVGTVRINAPTHVADTMLPFTPSADVFNYGNREETFLVRFIMMFANGDPFYRDSSVITLRPSTGRTQLFRQAKFLQLGHYIVSCSTALDVDEYRGNDAVTQMTKVCRPLWPEGWYEVASMPLLPSGKAVKKGGWLAFMRGAGLFFGAKGNKLPDFYCYDPGPDTWGLRRKIPTGTEAKLPANGAAATTDGNRYIYATKGNNTFGFWGYDAVTDSWSQLANVLPARSGKKVKGGSDLSFVHKQDTDYVYLLKGGRNDFCRYNVAARRWDQMPLAPQGANIKWDNGSWLAYDGERYIYAHKARYSELWKYDTQADTWLNTVLPGMPVYHPVTHQSRKSKDGSSAAWYDNAVYALKGANTTEYWKFDVTTNRWYDLDTIPSVGASGRRIRVKDGGDIAAFGDGVFFALKGNKSCQLWRYTLSAEIIGPAPDREGVMANPMTIADCRLSIAPNPLAAGFAALRYSLPGAGAARLSVYDVTGHRVVARTLAAGRSGSVNLDLRHLSNGVYLVKLQSADFAATQKLVVKR